MSNQWTPESVFDILADKKARQILAATNIAPRSAKELVDICDGSLSAIYRRIDVMTEYDMLDEKMQLSTDGHHSNKYTPKFHNVDVKLDRGKIVVKFEDLEFEEELSEEREIV